MKTDRKYELMDHTADFGIHLFGADEKDLFANAALALSDSLAEMTGGFTEAVSYDIHVTGDDLPDLMVNWLREILFFWHGKEMLIQDAKIVSVQTNELYATVKAIPYDSDRHVIKNDIKAVTYHDIQVWKGASGWEAKIIFDV